MKIKKEITKVTTFHDIFDEGGKVFRHGDDIYMTLEKNYLTAAISPPINTYNAVNLESGKLAHFGDKEEVELLYSELTVKSRN